MLNKKDLVFVFSFTELEPHLGRWTLKKNHHHSRQPTILECVTIDSCFLLTFLALLLTHHPPLGLHDYKVLLVSPAGLVLPSSLRLLCSPFKPLNCYSFTSLSLPVVCELAENRQHFLPAHYRGMSINTEKLCWYVKVRYGGNWVDKLRLKSKQYTKSFSSKIKLLLGKNLFQPIKQRHDDTKTLKISKVVVKTLFILFSFCSFLCCNTKFPLCMEPLLYATKISM